ncbi:hypothetical protein G7Y89_g166 [Cudoniella acicularis]|uniref:ubiquitinyl hydrolase 1 n=1 Tax=Cudoniella acicularis TaxID=354080 RepID=A0A8H4W871_9HELO|nr:hypothetical protein G7Y89_g166 [Cudoniella acicularis]
MEDRRLPRGPGKTAPRLINDLLDYDPKYREQRGGKNILADVAQRFRTVATPRKRPTDCRHALMKIVPNTVAPVSDDEQPNGDTKYVVSTFCQRCRYHFDITVDFTRWKDHQTPCKLSDPENPMHHLQLVESIYTKDQPDRLQASKYNPTLELHLFSCSRKTCPVQVDIKISAPRLIRSMLGPIMDNTKLHARGAKEIQKDPQRYTGLQPVTAAVALGYLKTYLADARAARNQPGPKRIAKRNKKYALAFGTECDTLFEYLDFKTIKEDTQEPDEEPAYFWRPPVITDTNSQFIDDVITELDVLLADRSPSEQQASNIRVAYHPLPALKDIERSLGYFDYPKRSRTVDLSKEEHPYYLSLGAVDDFTDELLTWAYDCQCECDPANKPYYLDCLEDLAKGRGSPDLQMKVVMATSAGEFGLKAIEDAYKFFGLDPGTKEGDDHIMGLYKSRIASAPRQKDEARNCLFAIAKARNSAKIEALANDKTMSHEEALEFFGVSSDTPSDSIGAAAVVMIQALDADKSKVTRALRVIANQRNDSMLKQAALDMETGNRNTMLDVGEAYSRLQISNRTVPDETIFAYYQSLTSDAAPGSKDSFSEALRAIATERNSNFLFTKLDDPNAIVQAGPSTADQPIGLDNIGNTCYLNSLLQYYYTVQPVRNVVMDFQNHRMSLNDEDIKKKRVGGRIVAKPEIIKAQKFVDELHNLYENLKTASTRSIKPTRELAELTIFSSAAEANFRRASISSPSGPPNLASILDNSLERPVYGPHLPPPPTRPSPSPVEDDIEMVDHPNEKNGDNGDNGDDSSEATLVDMDSLPSYSDATAKDGEKLLRSEKDQAAHDTSADGDAVMVNGEDFASGEKSLSVPEKQPPLPPRNKSGLVIQTNDSRNLISDDELWKFGSQQDVTEVIGNVNFRLQCAIKPTSIDERSGEQIDVVRDTLYGSNAVYLQKSERAPEQKVEAWANLIIFPAPTGTRDIYEALDVVFDEQMVEIDNTTAAQHASIYKLPPILHIQIQRTAFDSVKQIASKNRNPVTFPETIYLDRYLDSEDPESTLMRRRRETWKWKAQLRDLEARQAALHDAEAELSVPDALMAGKEFLIGLQETEELKDISTSPTLPDQLEERTAQVAEELGAISKEIAGIKQNLTEQFTDMRQYEYKLQAVFIHRGEAGGGHYWVYIYDFENDIWREYNDEYVTEVKDRRRIFDHQGGAGGTPYYLAYVRSADRKNLVEAVCREVPEVQEVQQTDPSSDWLEEGQDVCMAIDTDDENDNTRHVEHAKPRPLRPKPAADIAGWDTSMGSDLDANGREW